MFVNLLNKALAQQGLDLNATDVAQLAHYLELMQTWNRVFNLTALTTAKEMVYLHLIDSLIIYPYLHGKRMLDVGSGAGLPGIPLAILHPEQVWVLLDKNSKKTRFLTQVIAELALKNVSVINERCEDFHPHVGFDTILSRAFGTLRLFAETTEHMLNPGGMLLAMKGKYPHDELQNLPKRFHVDVIKQLTIHGMAVERHVICMHQA